MNNKKRMNNISRDFEEKKSVQILSKIQEK